MIPVTLSLIHILKFPNKQMEKIHVLLEEDEQTLAMINKDTLEEQDFIITTAGDGEEGLRKFFEQKPDVLVCLFYTSPLPVSPPYRASHPIPLYKAPRLRKLSGQ